MTTNHPNFRIPSKREVGTVVDALVHSLPTANDPVRDAIEADPELIRLKRAAAVELKKERKVWGRMQETLGFRSVVPASSRILVETCNNANVGFARVYRYLWSTEFQQAWAARDFQMINDHIVKELSLAVAFDRIKEHMTEGLATLIERISGEAVITARRVVPCVLMFLMVFMSLPPDNSDRESKQSWNDLSGKLLIATLKTVTLYAVNIWIGIPILTIFDDFCVQRQDLLDAGYEGSAWQAALKGSLLNTPFVSWVLRWTIWPQANHQVADDEILQENHFCDESFVDACNTLSIMRDPVIVHGFQMERSTFEMLLRHGHNHPFTRKRMLRAHMMEPSPAYRTLYLQYIQRRHEVIDTITRKTS